MKKIALLFAAVCAFCMVSCSNSSTPAAASSANTKADPLASALNIRFVSLDSVFMHYDYAISTNEEIQQLALQLQSEQTRLSNQLQTQATQIQEKLNSNGYLSQASYDADVRSLNQKQNSYQNQLAQREMSVNQLVAAKQQALLDSIDNFIAVFNAERGYDAILYTSASLYYNPALDITDEVIAGLNARYKAPAAAAKK